MYGLNKQVMYNMKPKSTKTFGSFSLIYLRTEPCVNCSLLESPLKLHIVNFFPTKTDLI